MDGMVRTNDCEMSDEVQYATTEEVLAAFYETLPQHDRTYGELAKGVSAPLSMEDEIEALEREATKTSHSG
jgi:hypothetical protein